MKQKNMRGWKLRKLALATILVLLITGIIFYPSHAEVSNYFSLIKVYWGTDKAIEVSPGDSATLGVVLRYDFGYSVKSVTADLSLPEGLRALGGGNRAETYFSGAISQSSIITMEFLLFLTKDAGRGGYMTYLELNYYIPDLSRWCNELLEVYFEVTGKPSIDFKALNSSLSEGTQLILVALTNKGDAVADNLKITRVNSISALSEFPEGATLGMLQPGQNIYVPVRIHVPTGLGSGLISLTIDGSCVGPTNVFYSFSKTLQLTLIRSTAISPLVLGLEPTKLVIGETSQVSINVKNSASHNISRIKLSLTPDAVMKIFGTSEFYINQLKPEERRQIYTDLHVPSTTTATTATLSIALTYLDEDLEIVQSNEQKLSLLLSVNPPTLASPLELSVEPTVLAIGKASDLLLKVTNRASYTIPEAILTLEPDAVLKVVGNNTYRLSSLEPNQTKSVHADVLIPLTTSLTTSLTVDLTYIDPTKGSTQNTQQTTNILLRGEIQIYLADIILIPSVPVSGRPFSITITLINTGSSPAYASYAVPLIEGLPVTQLGPHATYLGSMEANTQTSFTVNLQLQNTTRTSLEIPIILNYMNNLRSQYNTTFTVPITIQATPGTTPAPSPAPAQPLTFPISVIAVLVLSAVGVVLGLALVIRRSRLQK